MNEQEIFIINSEFKIMRYRMNFLLALILIILGMICNHSAHIYNDLKMPVFLDYKLPDTNTHSFYTDKSEVNNWILTDWINLGFMIISPGDVLMIGGFLMAMVYSYLCLYSSVMFKRRLKNSNGMEIRNKN